ncbi:MAG TPA: teichoic acid D-Ala incorporation-associated protein DltX [Roseiflexaceae bacterium]
MSAAADTPPRPAAPRRWSLSLGGILTKGRALCARPGVRLCARTIYYLAILVGLLLIYGRGDFSTPPFIYQGF